jgi:putative CocE/NonD family hydrolase
MGALADLAPELEQMLTRGTEVPVRFARSDIRRTTVWVTMRDGVRLATEVYLPPTPKAPSIVMRTPYGRATSDFPEFCNTLACAGYAVISQDCRGTGDSEPESWEYYVYEWEDGHDFVDWIASQPWFDGYIGGCGGSYVAQTQWCMSFHTGMSAIIPEVGGLGIAYHTARLYMFLNAYARTVGKGSEKVQIGLDELERQILPETLAGGFANEPLQKPFSAALRTQFPALRSLDQTDGRRWLIERYRHLPPADRAALVKSALEDDQVTISSIEAMASVFGHEVSHDAHMFACRPAEELCRSIQAPPLMVTGWYDWGLNDALATWRGLMQFAPPSVREHTRLIIGPNTHNLPGYHEGQEGHPELKRNFRTRNIIDLLEHWHSTVRANAVGSWPTAIYYLMGANEWQAADAWPPSDAVPFTLHLGSGGTLRSKPAAAGSAPDRYVYDPNDPTPTVGGDIVSYVYSPGSVDVSNVQKRSDVVTYTTAEFASCVDVVGPMRLVLYASSSAVDTDFSVRLSDVFPDGRAIQIQSGLLRTRFRNKGSAPKLLVSGQIYCLEIDMWATANRFAVGHRLRIDVCSSDFPRFDRNANLGGASGFPVGAEQTLYHDPDYPSVFTGLAASNNPMQG